MNLTGVIGSQGVVPTNKGTLALAGSGEYTPGMEPVDRHVRSAYFRPASHAVALEDLTRYGAVKGHDIAVVAFGQAVAAVTGSTVLLVVDKPDAFVRNIRGQHAKAFG